MHRNTLPLLAALATAGCAVEPLTLENDVTYVAEWVGDQAVVGRTPISLTLSGDRAYGNAGCNHWFAGYSLQGQRLSFSQAGSTRRACAPALMEQESRFLQALATVERWDISPIGQLRLWPASGKPIRLWPMDH